MTAAIDFFWLSGLWDSTIPTPGATLARIDPPVLTPTGNARIIRGDSYYAADDRALIWAFTGLPAAFNFTGSVTLFSAKKVSSLLQKDDALLGGVTSLFSGTTLYITMELSSADTVTLSHGDYTFDLQTTFSNGHVETWLSRGSMTVVADVR
jgi:hypothetical protein